MAEAAGGDWGQRAREAAVRLHARGRNYSVVEALLRDIKIVFDECGADSIKSQHLVEMLTENEDFEWANYRSATGVAFNVMEMASMLRRVGVGPSQRVRLEGQAQSRCFNRHQFEEAWSRYGV
jgi:hypothetical protein